MATSHPIAEVALEVPAHDEQEKGKKGSKWVLVALYIVVLMAVAGYTAMGALGVL